ncbi:hypothetical protein EV363DRAFT_1348899 [Boletus edulis]|nr:hypothetical protein EV363DRAFT_1348899 [Boletus edulis]
MFNAPRAFEETSSAWSDSDDDGFNLTGEYTGKFKVLKVPTKADSPTNEHMESWGRPVSPFPFSAIMERSLPLSEAAEDDGGREDVFDSMVPCEDLGLDVWEAATEPPTSDVEPSPPPSTSEDEFADLDKDFPVFDVDTEFAQVRPLVEPQKGVADSDQTIMEEQEEEAQIDRELSVAIDDGPDTLPQADQPIEPTDDDSSGEEDVVEGEGIIKITSEDPKAAARAAAILRMHDYDCILAAERKKRASRSAKSTRKRRKTIENAGISKSYMDWRNQRCETSPGSRSLPLLELWRDAEDTVFFEHHSTSHCDTSFTLSPLKAMTIHPRPQPLLPLPGGEWNRDCWKRLDKCLVAEQLAVAAACSLGTDLLGGMGDISKDAVLDRFMNQFGGESVLAGLGPEWSRDSLLVRLDVLVKKRSRHATRAPVFTRQDVLDANEPRYRGLLQEAMALSGATQRYPTAASIASDNTVVSERHAAHKISPDAETSWQTSCWRDLIRTPSRTPEPRPPHPKDQVHLRHASMSPKSMIPIPIRPKRLVDLRHLSPIKAYRGGWGPMARRNSGCSVKELVKQFEGLDK